VNVLLITVDQFRGDCLSAAVHPVVRTPGLDRLAAGGVRFSRHYSQAAPCGPGRACLYTGTYQLNNRVVGNGTTLADRFDGLLPADDRGVITRAASGSLHWEPIELRPGDAVCIGGLTPHRSDTNGSGAARRVLIASYAPVSDGYTRDRYYAARRTEIAAASARDGRDRISTLADFEGTMQPQAVADAPCAHP
jgi:hypothetical protein